MKRKIQELSSLTVNQIAAGEVVERPISIVKELVENSIDAGASAITVEIKNGGISFIRVTDNGSGIDKEEVRNAFCRHFTSKLEKIEDLYALDSLGFRGEALAAISGVTKTEMITKTEDSLVGVRISLEGMTEHTFEEIGAPNGTTLVIRDLFYNTPARRKFLKSEKTESSYIIEFMQRISLAYRKIAFKLIVDGKVKIQTNGDGDLKNAILYIFGSETAKRLKEVSLEEKGVAVSGYIGSPELNRGNRNYEIYFVNGRYVKSKWIQEGIEEGAFGYVMQHQFPFAALEIKVMPDKLDVNVHPQKAEVRFENGYIVKEVVKKAVANAFIEKEMIVEVALDKTPPAFQPDAGRKSNYSRIEPFEKNRQDREKIGKIEEIVTNISEKTESTGKELLNGNVPDLKDYEEKSSTVSAVTVVQSGTDKEEINRENMAGESYHYDAKRQPSVAVMEKAAEFFGKPLQVPFEKSFGVETAETIQTELEEQEFIALDSLKKHRVIGQVFDTYWLIEFGGSLYIIDQHAAHEKVLYEKFVERFNQSQIHSQQLLEAFVIELSAREMENFMKSKDSFAKLGFEVEVFGSASLKLNGVPYLFNTAMAKEDFVYLLDQLDSKKLSSNAQTIDHELATMACKAAVKGNNKLSRIEYERLIEELLQLNNPYHCPHGRPTLIKMTRYELDRKFKRIL